MLYERRKAHLCRVWSRRLVNPIAPEYAVVADDGRYVATLNDYPRGGAAHALVFYDRGGRPLREFSLRELLQGDDWRHVRAQRHAVRWLDGATYGFDPDAPRFVIRLAWGRRIVIDLIGLTRLEPGAAATAPSADSQPAIPPEILALLDPSPGAPSSAPADAQAAIDAALRRLRNLGALAAGPGTSRAVRAEETLPAAGRPLVPAPDPAHPVDYVAWFFQWAESDGPSAVPHYRAAIDALVRWEGDREVYDKALHNDPETLARPDVQAWIEANRAALDNYFAAVGLEYRGMPQPSTDGTLIGLLLPTLRDLRELARITEADANLREQRGDLDGAIEDHLQNIKAGAQLSHGHTLIDHLVGVAIEALGSTRILDFIARHEDDDLDYAALAERLETETRPAAPLREALAGEKAMVYDLAQRLFAWDDRQQRYRIADDAFDTLSDTLGAYANDPAGDLLSLMALSRNGFERTRRRIDKYYDEAGRYLDEPYPVARQALDEFDARFGSVGATLRYPLLGKMAASWERVAFVRARAEATRRAAIAVLKIKAYRRQHGTLPDSLDELGDDEALIDPITGDYFAYRRTDDGFVLYSLGHNGTDESGKGDPHHYETEDIPFWPRRQR